jgi:hypothetical protein
MSTDKVSAVIVTRGDVPLDAILASLRQVPRIDDVCIWDNSQTAYDAKTWGRHAALPAVHHGVIYSQDDDLVHEPEAIGRILDAYRPGVLTGCMWPEWSAAAERQGIAGGYSDLAFPGSGSVYDREVPLVAAGRYLARHPLDEFFLTWCDAVIGVLAPTVQLDERFRTLPAAHLPDRLARLDKGGAKKREAMERARFIRDGAPKRDAHELYSEELKHRLERRS